MWRSILVIFKMRPAEEDQAAEGNEDQGNQEHPQNRLDNNGEDDVEVNGEVRPDEPGPQGPDNEQHQIEQRPGLFPPGSDRQPGAGSAAPIPRAISRSHSWPILGPILHFFSMNGESPIGPGMFVGQVVQLWVRRAREPVQEAGQEPAQEQPPLEILDEPAVPEEERPEAEGQQEENQGEADVGPEAPEEQPEVVDPEPEQEEVMDQAAEEESIPEAQPEEEPHDVSGSAGGKSPKGSKRPPDDDNSPSAKRQRL